MTKFKFKLQRILDYRETIEDKTYKEFGYCKSRLEKAEMVINRLLKEREGLNKSKNDLANNAKVMELKMLDMHIKNLNIKIKEQNKLILEIRNELQEIQDRLVKASIDKKTLEKLKERDKESYNYIVKKEEEKMVDQLVSFKNTVK